MHSSLFGKNRPDQNSFRLSDHEDVEPEAASGDRFQQSLVKHEFKDPPIPLMSSSSGSLS